MKKLGLFLISFFYLIYFLSFNISLKNTILDVSILFITTIMPSILPIYWLGNILLINPFLSKLIFPFLRRIIPLENETACTIYLLSIIMGNPTTTLLINENINSKVITINQGKKLMSITSFMNPLFIISICPKGLIIPIILGSIIASILIGLLIKKLPHYSSKEKITYFSNVLDKTPTFLLNILMLMLLVSMIKIPFKNLPFPYIYLIDSLDISSGLIKVTNYPINDFWLLTFLTILINSNGICLFLQTLRVANFIKTKELIKKRLISTLTSLLVTLFIYLLF